MTTGNVVADGLEAPSPEHLRPGRFIDSASEAVRAYALEAAGDAATPEEIAVRLFYAVRDDIRYDPYTDFASPDSFVASRCLEVRLANCIGKASALCAAARAMGIPSRLALADVRNHLATPKMVERMGTDVFRFHGYSELWLGGRWVKATPTFNKAMCERFGVKALDFNGRDDSIFHEFDAGGERRHMEYLLFRGTFADVPFDEIAPEVLRLYPGLAEYCAEIREGRRDKSVEIPGPSA